MAICPFARQELLPENRTAPKTIPVQAIVHTADDAPGKTRLWLYFARRDVVDESTFFIMTDGTIVQMMDTERKADANLEANRRAISIETEDDGRPLRPWTDAQVASLIKLGKWINQTHGIPFRLCTNPTAAGWGWHSMWNFPDDPEGQTGRWVPSPWTRVRGKICPGPTRIKQLRRHVLPGMARDQLSIVKETSNVDKQQVATFQRLLNKHFNAGLKVDGDYGPKTAAAAQTAFDSDPASVWPNPDTELAQLVRSAVATLRKIIEVAKA